MHHPWGQVRLDVILIQQVDVCVLYIYLLYDMKLTPVVLYVQLLYEINPLQPAAIAYHYSLQFYFDE